MWRDAPDWKTAPWFYRNVKRTLGPAILGAFRTRYKGADNVPREGAVLVAPNHQSWIDPIAVAAVIPRPMHFLAKKEMWSNPVKGAFITWISQAIPVDREARGQNPKAYEAARERLAQGWAVGVYPEAHRTRDGKLLPFRPGLARLALQTGVPVVPVGQLTRPLMPRGVIVPRFGRRSYVNVGEPLTFEKHRERGEAREVVDEVTGIIRERIQALLAECERAYEDDERW
ncbi:MAG: lysophospholipid acyltransferase family protein [Methanobacteriota archaeon]